MSLMNSRCGAAFVKRKRIGLLSSFVEENRTLDTCDSKYTPIYRIIAKICNTIAIKRLKKIGKTV